MSYNIIHYAHYSAGILTSQCSLDRLTERCWSSKGRSWLAGDEEGAQRPLALCSLQMSTSGQDLAGGQFMIEGVEHFQNVGFPCAIQQKTEQMSPPRECCYGTTPARNCIQSEAQSDRKCSFSHFTGHGIGVLLAVCALRTVLRVAAGPQSAEQDFPEGSPRDVLKRETERERAVLRRPARPLTGSL